MRRWVGVVLLLAVVGVAACAGDDDTALETSDAVQLSYEMADDLSAGDVDAIRTTIEERLDALGARDVSVDVDGRHLRIGVGEPGGATADDLGATVATTGELRFRPVLQAVPMAAGDAAALPLTPPDQDEGDAVVVLGGVDGDPQRYQLGAAEATGAVIETSRAQLDGSGTWVVALVLTEDGIILFNAIAGRCYDRSATCPTGQLAIVLDSLVQSAPTVEQASFERDQIQITGAFDEEEAKRLALVLQYGSLPTTLTPSSSAG